ncbi:hypothetical protein ATANTOWER_002784 [Ataeniobius toweri]|uniref:Transposase n=1 Tax=Ataeniobius toweri TaxID=208326 RepID=A0ABU7AVM7_9TELE|nr:hypothetical protein [Ataeniobius toweri]
MALIVFLDLPKNLMILVSFGVNFCLIAQDSCPVCGDKFASEMVPLHGRSDINVTQIYLDIYSQKNIKCFCSNKLPPVSQEEGLGFISQPALVTKLICLVSVSVDLPLICP